MSPVPAENGSIIQIPEKRSDEHRLVFVELMFAFAVTEIATHLAELQDVSASFRDKVPSYAHLLLSLAVVTLSWFGWRNSPSPGMKEQVRDFVSIPFFGLLIDVVLVILYYVLAHSVEVANVDSDGKLPPASAEPEAFWLILIFGGYVLWDLLTDIFSPGCIEVEGSSSHWWTGVRAVPVSVFASVLAVVMTLVVWCLARNNVTWAQVLVLDIALLTVAVSFRLSKVAENWLRDWCGVRHLRAFEKTRELRLRHKVVMCLCAAGYIFAIVFVCC